MDKRLKDKGLVIVAPEVQGSSEDMIKQLVDEKEIPYTVTAGIQGPRLGNSIPRTAVFDVTGKLIFVGRPGDEAERVIKKALKDVTASAEPTSGLAPRKKDLVALRGWTNTDGKTMQATLVEVDGTTGHFKFKDGRKFTYDITKLSQANQDDIKAAQEAANPSSE